MFTILISLFVAIAASIITWLLCKARLTQHTIFREDYIKLQEQFTQLQTSEAVLRSLLADAHQSRGTAETRLQLATTRIEEIGTKAAVSDTRCISLQETNGNLSNQLFEAQTQLTTAQKSLTEAQALNIRLQATIEAKEALLAEQKTFIEKVKAEMEREFRLIAANTVDQSTKTLGEQQATKLTDLLKPFREQIHTFQEAVGKHFVEEGKEKTALQKEIELLARSSQLLTKQATDLTEALRGSTKQQGDWGEGILERILEHCGLKEGIDYSIQASEKSHDGKAYRPDVVLHMVGGRNLVIDSKVSLNAYWDMCACDDTSIRPTFLPAICSALRKHIDELHRRPYGEVNGTPGYLIMFIPVEAAYITALQHEGSLWQYAYDKGVLLISPTNLIPFMRMVESLWDRDKKYKNAENIAKSAGLLYDKLVGFVKNYEKLGTALSAAQSTYDDSFAQLAKGRGNLIAKAEEMKALKISNKSHLPTAIAESAMLADGILLPDAQPDNTRQLP